MWLFRVFVAILVVALAALGFKFWRNPYPVELPTDPVNVASIEGPLSRLKPGERELVEAYLQRRVQDASAPLKVDATPVKPARTVAEAIEAQRLWLDAQTEMVARAEARRTARESKLGPLREALKLELLRREILPRDQVLAARVPTPGKSKPAMAATGPGMLVTTWRVTNTSGQAIEMASAGINVRRVQRAPTDLGLLMSCFLPGIDKLRANASIEAQCGSPKQLATAQDEAFVAMAPEEFVIEWEPRSIRFANGRELRYTE